MRGAWRNFIPQGSRDRRKIARPKVLPERAEELPTIHPRHLEIDQDQVGQMAKRVTNAGAAVRGVNHLEAESFQSDP